MKRVRQQVSQTSPRGTETLHTKARETWSHLKHTFSVKAYTSLPAPHSKPSRYYAKQIKRTVKAGAKNIAIIGDRGSGKTSAMLNAERKILRFHRFSRRVRYVNLLSLASTFKKKKISLHKLEDEIFKQLRYGEEPIGVRRLKAAYTKRGILVLSAIAIAITLAILLVAWLDTKSPNANAFIAYIAKAINIPLWSVFACTLTLLAIIAFGIFAIISYTLEQIYFRNISKIGPLIFKGAQDYELNRPLADIFALFSTQKLEIIVFEDFDRSENREIIDNLCRLNYLLNRDRHRNKQVVFIYSINDNTMKTEKRGRSTRIKAIDLAKQFDACIYIVPFYGSLSADSHMLEELKATGVDLCKDKSILRLSDALDLLKQDFSDMRSVRLLCGCVNNLLHAQKTDDYSEKRSSAKALGIAMLRIVHPDLYLKPEILAKVRSELYDVEEELDQVLTRRIEVNERLKNEPYRSSVFGDILRELSHAPKFKSGIEKIDGEGLSSGAIACLAERMVSAGKNTFTVTIQTKDKKSLKVTAEELCAASPTLSDYRYLKSILGYRVEEAREVLRNKAKGLQMLGLPLEDEYYLMGIMDEFEANISKTLSSLSEDQEEYIRKLLHCGLMDDNYGIYLSPYRTGYLRYKAFRYKNDILDTKTHIFNYEICEKDIKNLLSSIPESYFWYPGMLNYKIIDYVVRNNKKEILDRVCGMGFNYQEELNDFIRKYCKNRADRVAEGITGANTIKDLVASDPVLGFIKASARNRGVTIGGIIASLEDIPMNAAMAYLAVAAYNGVTVHTDVEVSECMYEAAKKLQGIISDEKTLQTINDVIEYWKSDHP